MQKKVLVLDGNALTHSLIGSILETDELSVLHEYNEDNYLNKVSDIDPDMICIGVDNHQGLKNFANLRNNPAAANLPVIVLVPRRTISDGPVADSLTAIVEKPFEASELQRQTSRFLGTNDFMGTGLAYQQSRAIENKVYNPEKINLLDQETIDLFNEAKEHQAEQAQHHYQTEQSQDEHTSTLISGYLAEDGEAGVNLADDELDDVLRPEHAFEEIDESNVMSEEDLTKSLQFENTAGMRHEDLEQAETHLEAIVSDVQEYDQADISQVSDISEDELAQDISFESDTTLDTSVSKPAQSPVATAVASSGTSQVEHADSSDATSESIFERGPAVSGSTDSQEIDSIEGLSDTYDVMSDSDDQDFPDLVVKQIVSGTIDNEANIDTLSAEDVLDDNDSGAEIEAGFDHTLGESTKTASVQAQDTSDISPLSIEASGEDFVDITSDAEDATNTAEIIVADSLATQHPSEDILLEGIKDDITVEDHIESIDTDYTTENSHDSLENMPQGEAEFSVADNLSADIEIQDSILLDDEVNSEDEAEHHSSYVAEGEHTQDEGDHAIHKVLAGRNIHDDDKHDEQSDEDIEVHQTASEAKLVEPSQAAEAEHIEATDYGIEENFEGFNEDAPALGNEELDDDFILKVLRNDNHEVSEDLDLLDEEIEDVDFTKSSSLDDEILENYTVPAEENLDANQQPAETSSEQLSADITLSADEEHSPEEYTQPSAQDLNAEATEHALFEADDDKSEEDFYEQIDDEDLPTEVIHSVEEEITKSIEIEMGAFEDDNFNIYNGDEASDDSIENIELSEEETANELASSEIELSATASDTINQETIALAESSEIATETIQEQVDVSGKSSIDEVSDEAEETDEHWGLIPDEDDDSSEEGNDEIARIISGSSEVDEDMAELGELDEKFENEFADLKRDIKENPIGEKLNSIVEQKLKDSNIAHPELDESEISKQLANRLGEVLDEIITRSVQKVISEELPRITSHLK